MKRHPELSARVQQIAQLRLKELEDVQEIAQAELDAAEKHRAETGAD